MIDRQITYLLVIHIFRSIFKIESKNKYNYIGMWIPNPYNTLVDFKNWNFMVFDVLKN